MSDMKCPFCQQELQETFGIIKQFWCSNYKDPTHPINLQGTKELWQELIRTRKALKIAVDMLKLVYQGNGDPQDIMRYKDNRWTAVRRLCKQTLEQITELEQKDK